MKIPKKKSANKTRPLKPAANAIKARNPGHAHAQPASQSPAARCAVLILSDSRTLKTDTAGATAVQLLAAAGHRVAEKNILPDDIEAIWGRVAALANTGLYDLILLTGGTGISLRDVTPEAVRPLFEKELPGFGEIFRLLSYREIGPAAFFSRAVAGIVKRSLVICLPGSPAAVTLALRELLLPELGHLVSEMNKHGPAAGVAIPG